MISPALLAYLQAQRPQPPTVSAPPDEVPRFAETVEVNASAPPPSVPISPPPIATSFAETLPARPAGALGEPLTMTGPPTGEGAARRDEVSGRFPWAKILGGLGVVGLGGLAAKQGALTEAITGLGTGFANAKAEELKLKRRATFEQEQKQIEAVHQVVLEKIGTLPQPILEKFPRLTTLAQKYRQYLAQGSENGKTLSPREAADLLADWTTAQHDFESAARVADDLRLEEQEVAKARAAETRMVPFYQQATAEDGARPTYLPSEPRPQEIVPPPGMEEEVAREAIRRDQLAKLRADVPQRVKLDDGTEAYLTPSQLLTMRGQDVRKDIADLRNEVTRELAAARGEPLYPVVEGNTVVYRPRSAAAGAHAPRTVFDSRGVPTLGGVEGQSTVAPPAVPDKAQSDLAGYDSLLGQVKPVSELLKTVGTFGPGIGHIRLIEVEKLGGLGATKQELELATRLRRMLSSQAFADGGKQLTGTERGEFAALTPALTDTLANATTKLRLMDEWLRNRKANRLANMPARQRAQLLGGSYEMTPPPGAEPKVRRRRLASGHYEYQHSLDGGATWRSGRPQ